MASAQIARSNVGFTSATIPIAGTTINVVFTKACTGTEETGWTLAASGGAVTVSSGSGTGTTSWTLTLSRTIDFDETVTIAYSPGDIKTANGNRPLGAFSARDVTNNSTQGGGEVSAQLAFEDASVPVEGLRVLVIDDGDDRAVFCGTTDENGVVDLSYRNPNTLNDATYSIIAGDTTYGYRDLTWTTATSNTFDVITDDEYVLPELPMGAIPLSQGDGSPMTLNTLNGYYYFTEDIEFDGTGLLVGNTGITVDQRRFRLTWQNRAPIAIDNPSWETQGATSVDADGWTLSADADRVQGVFLSKQVDTVGSWGLKITAPAADQDVAVNDTAVTLETGVTYSLAAKLALGSGVTAATLKVQLVGATETHEFSLTGSPQGAMPYRFVTFTPATDTSYELRVRIEGAGALTGSAYVDTIQIGRVGEYAIGPKTIPAGFRLTNAIVVQGQHSAVAGTQSGTDEDLRSRTMYQTGASTIDHNVIYQYKDDSRTAIPQANAVLSNNIFIARGRWTSNRGQQYSYPFNFAVSTFSFHHNILDYQPQGGLKLASGTGNDVTSNGFLGNSYETNGFALYYAECSNSTCEKNYLAVNSRGLAIEVQDGNTGVVVNDNTGWVEELQQNQEYGGCILNGAYAIQCENPSGEAELFNNHVRGYAVQCDCSALRHGPGTDYLGNLSIHDNTFEVICSSNSLSASSVSPNHRDVDDAVFSGNTLISNRHWIGGQVHSVTSYTLTDCTFTKVATDGIDFYPFVAVVHASPMLNDLIIHNPSYGAGTTQDDLDTPIVDENFNTDADSSFRVEDDMSALIFEYTGGTRNP